jgi:hypothetical protein
LLFALCAFALYRCEEPFSFNSNQRVSPRLFLNNPVGMTIAHRPSSKRIVSGKDGQTLMLWTILLVLLVLWLLGLLGGIGGNLIHLLLLVALVVLIIQLITGRRAVI